MPQVSDHHRRDLDDWDGDENVVYERPRWLTETPYWAISAVLHLALVLVLLAILLPEKEKEPPAPAITVRPPQKVPEYDPTRKRDVKRNQEILSRKPTELPERRKPDEVTPDIPKGTSLDNQTNVHRANDLATPIGITGGAASLYGERSHRGTIIAEGGSVATEEAVRAALEWLMRHQGSDGGWHAADFAERSKRGESRNKNHKRYPTDRGWETADVGVTGLAMLAFLGYGHTHRFGEIPEYRQVLRRAMNYMKKQQVQSSDVDSNGRYGQLGPSNDEHWIYNHAIATMAMAELLVMSDDFLLKNSVEDAVKLILRARNDTLGWRYGIADGDNDTSVTGWMVLALKTAKNYKLDIETEEYDRAFSGALEWFRAATNTRGRTGYQDPGDPGSKLDDFGEPYPYSKEPSCMTAVAVLCRLFAGETRKDAAIKGGVSVLMRHPPEWREQKGRVLSTINLYYWYYASYALFQYGGKPWAEWNPKMQQALLESQRVGGDEDGSWDPIGEWGIAGGRVYSTAIGAMTLEVYYRFRRTQDGTGF